MCPAPIASPDLHGTSRVPTQRTRPETQAYSAYTSLLEDSPLKVYLQEYNPVCIREHGGCGRDVIQGICDGAGGGDGPFGQTEARGRQDKQEGGQGEEDEGMVWWRRNLARGDRTSNYPSEVTPVSAARVTTGPTCVSPEATSYGQRRSRSRRTRRSGRKGRRSRVRPSWSSASWTMSRTKAT